MTLRAWLLGESVADRMAAELARLRDVRLEQDLRFLIALRTEPATRPGRKR